MCYIGADAFADLQLSLNEIHRKIVRTPCRSLQRERLLSEHPNQ